MPVHSTAHGYVQLRNEFGNGFNAEFIAGATAPGKIDMDLTYVFENEDTEDNLGLLMTLDDAYGFAYALFEVIRELEEYEGLEPRDFSDALKYANWNSTTED